MLHTESGTSKTWEGLRIKIIIIVSQLRKVPHHFRGSSCTDSPRCPHFKGGLCIHVSVMTVNRWEEGGVVAPRAAVAIVVSTLYTEILDVEKCTCGCGASGMEGLSGNGLR